MKPILTNAKGVPYAYPDKPPADAAIDDKIEWLRRCHEINNAIANDANQAFADAFVREIRRRLTQNEPPAPNA